ncbi:MAG: cytidine deaminase [Thermaerobacter sp.]|nr:cytidine deaminase [Thermaerobacter sp.]
MNDERPVHAPGGEHPSVAERAIADLVQAARGIRARAYAPYSHFPVGAALLCADGTVITGVNVENASSPLACCAERAAVYAAVAAGQQVFRAIAVVGGERPLTPCGGCRQVLAEFGDLTVVAATPDPAVPVRSFRLSALLPESFGKEDVGV